MQETQWEPRKVVIVGAGAVGATFAYALAQNGDADVIQLIDLNQTLAEGQVLDLAHGLPYFPPVKIQLSTKEDYTDASAIVITAGAKQNPGETRLDLLQRNVAITERIVDDIVTQGSNGVIVMVSNPVDILTYVALKRTGWPRGRIIGSGTVLDSARFRYLLSQHCDVDVRNVHAYILGEHGDSEFAAWSMTNIAGVAIEQYCPRCHRCEDWDVERARIEEEVRRSAYHIIDYKGATYFAIGLALVRIVGAILRSQRSVLTVSTRLDGEYGLDDICLSVPCVLSRDGIEHIIEAELPSDEHAALSESASVLRNVLGEIERFQ